jgi:cytochrome c-type biogenesis protein CcmH/NrfG
VKKGVIKCIKFLIIIICVGIVIQKITYKIQDVRLEKERKEMFRDSVSPVTRSYKVLPITEDSLYLQRLERSTKELLK